jgi:glutathione S-transferase
MNDLILTTYDWVPNMPRGHVRDLRIRWALEEAGLPYRVESTSFHDRQADHFARHPFGQVPWLTDGDLVIFESGAILLHLGEQSDRLMPKDQRGRSAVKVWLFAALASVEAASQPWSFFKFAGTIGDGSMWPFFEGFLNQNRLPHLERELARRDWLAGEFSIADIVMADVLRVVDRFDGLVEFPDCKAYVTRATARPAFAKALADQMAHFAAADQRFT